MDIGIQVQAVDMIVGMINVDMITVDMITVDMITEDMTVTPGIMAPLTRHVYRGDLDGRYYGTIHQARIDSMKEHGLRNDC